MRRNSSGGLTGDGGSPNEGRASGKRPRSRGAADSGKSKRVKQKAAEQAVSMGVGLLARAYVTIAGCGYKRPEARR